VPRAKLACGRVGGDGCAARQTCIKALLGASCLHRPPAGVLAWRGESVPHTSWWRRSCPRLTPRVVAHAPFGIGGELAWDVVFSCEVESCRARRRLIEGVPLVGNWSEMLPTGREHDVLAVRVLTGILSPPCLESWPSHCQSWHSRCQWC
jgi:hypothetical protein